MHEISDQELLKRFEQGGNHAVAAFKLLVGKYQTRLYWHIRKMVVLHHDADDLLQIVFVKVWKALPQFRQEAKLFTWLYRIATNECLSFLKKKQQQHIVSVEDTMPGMAEALEGDSYFNGDEAQLKLQQAILLLPEKQRLVFNMKYFDELKYEQISEILDTSVGALKASYHHAVKKIEQYIKST